ncbi:hypothetical protein JCM3766R1_000670 [Sporobolomyces carnicolor]
MGRTALVTVGSTEFTALVSVALSPSFISQLAASLNVTSLYAQIGTSKLPHGSEIGARTLGGVEIEVVRFANDLEQRVAAADLVVSHAGAGSILSFLRPVPAPSPTCATTARERRLIVVPNDSLMDSHQSDLADEMERKGWAIVCRDPEGLAKTVDELARSRSSGPSSVEHRFPDLDKGKVQRIFDETLGLA